MALIETLKQLRERKVALDVLLSEAGTEDDREIILSANRCYLAHPNLGVLSGRVSFLEAMNSWYISFARFVFDTYKEVQEEMQPEWDALYDWKVEL